VLVVEDTKFPYINCYFIICIYLGGWLFAI